MIRGEKQRERKGERKIEKESERRLTSSSLQQLLRTTGTKPGSSHSTQPSNRSELSHHVLLPRSHITAKLDWKKKCRQDLNQGYLCGMWASFPSGELTAPQCLPKAKILMQLKYLPCTHF